MSLFEELKRRNVFRVAIAYLLLGWAVLQGADFLLDLVGAPEWVIRALAVIGLVGLPFALFFAWAFELTPEGIKREEDIDRSQPISTRTGRKLNGVIIGLLVVIILLMAVERMFFAGGAPSGPADGTAAVDKTIAVLPFADLSQARDQEWFADGLAEEILNALVKVPDIQVTARTSSFAFKGSNREIPEIAAELGVAHVLEGSVRSSGDRIRVTAQLIRASDGFHVWSQNYDRDVADMISIQEDLARSIAMALETSMDPAALEQMAQTGTDSVEAYQAYLRGLQLRAEAETYSVGKRLELTRQAYEQFERARTIDPGFAEAHVLAANFWRYELTPNRMETGISGRTSDEMLSEYNERISRAIDTARSEADRIHGLADRALVDLRLREAQDLYERYLEMRPNDDLARYDYVSVLLMLREWEAANRASAYWKNRSSAELEAALQYVQLAWRSGHAAEAAQTVVEGVQRWPNVSQLFYQGHRTLMWAGQVEEGRKLAARFEILVPGGHPALMGRQACAEGDREAAERIFSELDPAANNSDFLQWFFLNLLGRTDEEIAFIRSMLARRTTFEVASFLIYPQFDPRPYPELMALLEREGVQRLPPVEPPFKCPPPVEPSVAVLPFQNMSADPDQAYFSDGITEEIINALVGVPGVKVAARTSVFAFKDRNADIRAIGDELGVTHVVEGSVRSDSQQLRITAQLIQVSDGFHLWSETFDRQRVNVFAIQEEIAAAIAGELSEQLGDKAPAPEVARISVKAYDDYLRGRALLRERGDDGLEQALALFEAVVAAHPDYAPGWASLAITADVEDDHELAETAALRALELDPANVDALTALGGVYRDTRQWALAGEQFEKAMALDSDSAELLEDYGEFLARTGRMDTLLKVTSHGFAVDPYLAPLVEVYAIGLMSAGDSERAIEILETATQRSDWEWLNGALASAYIQNRDEAALRRLISTVPLPDAERAALLGVLDRPDDAGAAAELEAMYRPGDRNSSGASFYLAENMLLYRGRTEPLIEAYTRRIADFGTLQNDYWFLPAYAPLRAAPGFPALLEQSGLPAYWDQTGWPDFCRREGEAIVCR